MAVKSRFLRHTMLWALTAPIVLLLAVPALTGPEGYGLRRSEVESAQRIFGREAHERLAASVDRSFRRLFIDSGAVAWTMRGFVTETHGPLGVEKAAGAASSRWVEAFWLALYQAMYRARLAGEWLWAVAAIVTAAFADGLAARAIRRAGAGYTNPYAFHLAAHALIALLGAGLALLFAPIPVHPAAFPLLATGAGLAAWRAAANFQTGG